MALKCQHVLRPQVRFQACCVCSVDTLAVKMGNVLKWFRANRLRLLQHFSVKKPACEPSTEWWLVVIIIQALVERIEKTFSAMQGMKTLVCEQRRLLMELEHDIKERCNIKGPMTNEEALAFSNAIANDPSYGFQLHIPSTICSEKLAIVDTMLSCVSLS